MPENQKTYVSNSGNFSVNNTSFERHLHKYKGDSLGNQNGKTLVLTKIVVKISLIAVICCSECYNAILLKIDVRAPNVHT